MSMTLLKGFITSGSLILAIGAQNAFVIKQGLQRRHLLLTACLCSLIDALLISLGVLGFGEIVSAYPSLIYLSKYFAVTFLLCYGAISLKSVFTIKSLNADGIAIPSRKKTILLLLGFSLLNPHVYLDTVILLGSIAAQQPEQEQLYFGLGAISASFVWFFALTYCSQFLAPFLRNPTSWKIIDSLVAITMFGIAITLMISII